MKFIKKTKKKKEPEKKPDPKKKVNGRPWKKGQSGNPKGRVKLTPDQRKMKSLTQDEYLNIANELIYLNLRDLVQLTKEDTTSSLKMMMIAVIVRAIKTGDEKKITFYLDRLIGTIRSKVEVTGASGGPFQYAHLSDEEMDDRMDKLMTRWKKFKQK